MSYGFALEKQDLFYGRYSRASNRTVQRLDGDSEVLSPLEKDYEMTKQLDPDFAQTIEAQKDAYIRKK